MVCVSTTGEALIPPLRGNAFDWIIVGRHNQTRPSAKSDGYCELEYSRSASNVMLIQPRGFLELTFQSPHPFYIGTTM
jgi:hypothetical protein